ncbi:MAG TPA: neutral zinc metallopeptidase [Streptosporangiaceae bacterium]|nr:neutral zinc metallopeptidase [Streptosporangiaceae bacterium]
MVGPNPSVPPRGYVPQGGRPGPANPYALPVRYSPPRRSAGSGVVGALGAVAAVMVIGVVALSAFAGDGGDDGTASGGVARRAGRATATGNPLYKTGELRPVPCRLPRIVPGSGASMKGFMDTLTGCLDTVWRQQFSAADIAFGRPNRVFWAQPGRSPCGSYPQPGAAAFYCAVNNTMYVGLRNIIETAGNEPVSHYAVYARVIAHEYGHHVQHEAGILAYGHQLMNRQNPLATAEASRRIELQAQCLAGAFLGAERATLPMTDEQYHAMVADVFGRGDDHQPPERRDHGSARHYAGWVIIGFTKRVLSACNTWTAAASEVS